MLNWLLAGIVSADIPRRSETEEEELQMSPSNEEHALRALQFFRLLIRYSVGAAVFSGNRCSFFSRISRHLPASSNG